MGQNKVLLVFHMKLNPFCNKPWITLVYSRCKKKQHSIYFSVFLRHALTQAVSEKTLQLIVQVLLFCFKSSSPKICQCRHNISELSNVKLKFHLYDAAFCLATEKFFYHIVTSLAAHWLHYIFDIILINGAIFEKENVILQKKIFSIMISSKPENSCTNLFNSYEILTVPCDCMYAFKKFTINN
jgi:hypothetical protein